VLYLSESRLSRALTFMLDADLWFDSDEEWQEGKTVASLTEASDVDSDNGVDTR
jgi:hypothetical protein